jgi:hypothetical protein
LGDDPTALGSLAKQKLERDWPGTVCSGGSEHVVEIHGGHDSVKGGVECRFDIGGEERRQGAAPPMAAR